VTNKVRQYNAAGSAGVTPNMKHLSTSGLISTQLYTTCVTLQDTKQYVYTHRHLTGYFGNVTLECTMHGNIDHITQLS